MQWQLNSDIRAVGVGQRSKAVFRATPEIQPKCGARAFHYNPFIPFRDACQRVATPIMESLLIKVHNSSSLRPSLFSGISGRTRYLSGILDGQILEMKWLPHICSGVVNNDPLLCWKFEAKFAQHSARLSNCSRSVAP